MKKYEGLSKKELFLELVLEILHSCLVPETLNDAKLSLGELAKFIETETVTEEVEIQFHKATETFNKLLEKFESTDENSINNGDYNTLLTELRDELLAAQELYQ